MQINFQNIKSFQNCNNNKFYNVKEKSYTQNVNSDTFVKSNNIICKKSISQPTFGDAHYLLKYVGKGDYYYGWDRLCPELRNKLGNLFDHPKGNKYYIGDIISRFKVKDPSQYDMKICRFTIDELLELKPVMDEAPTGCYLLSGVQRAKDFGESNPYVFNVEFIKKYAPVVEKYAKMAERNGKVLQEDDIARTFYVWIPEKNTPIAEKYKVAMMNQFLSDIEKVPLHHFGIDYYSGEGKWELQEKSAKYLDYLNSDVIKRYRTITCLIDLRFGVGGDDFKKLEPSIEQYPWGTQALGDWPCYRSSLLDIDEIIKYAPTAEKNLDKIDEFQSKIFEEIRKYKHSRGPDTWDLGEQDKRNTQLYEKVITFLEDLKNSKALKPKSEEEITSQSDKSISKSSVQSNNTPKGILQPNYKSSLFSDYLDLSAKEKEALPDLKLVETKILNSNGKEFSIEEIPDISIFGDETAQKNFLQYLKTQSNSNYEYFKYINQFQKMENPFYNVEIEISDNNSKTLRAIITQKTDLKNKKGVKTADNESIQEFINKIKNELKPDKLKLSEAELDLILNYDIVNGGKIPKILEQYMDYLKS